MRVGTNLRLELIDDFLQEKPPLACLEIIAENFFSAGVQHRKLEMLRKEYDISLHCLSMNIGGSDPLDIGYLDKIKELKKNFAPMHISGHLSFESYAGKYFHDLLPFPFTPQTLQEVTARINNIQEYLCEYVLIENLSYYVEFKENTIAEVDFINAVTNSTGAKILLDINNLCVNQQNLGHSAENFLQAINWQRVAEIHLAGAETVDNLQIDSHGEKVPAAVLKMLCNYRHHLLEKTPIIYERDTNLLSYTELISYCHDLEKNIFVGN